MAIKKAWVGLLALAMAAAMTSVVRVAALMPSDPPIIRGLATHGASVASTTAALASEPDSGGQMTGDPDDGGQLT